MVTTTQDTPGPCNNSIHVTAR